MADKETGLNIPIGAYADENSAEKAVKDITKKIDSSLKDGRIEIPIELRTPIKGASDDLIKAQEDVIKKWDAASKKGFSSSTKEANDLIDAYTRYKKLVGQAHKNNQTQVKDLDAIISKKIQSLKIERDTSREERKTKINTSRNKSITKSDDKSLQTLINKKYGYDKLQKELSKGAGRAKASTPGSPINLGLRLPNMSGPYIDEKTLRMSEISPYRNMNEAKRAKEQQEIRARERASLTSHKATTEDIDDADRKVKQREANGRPQSGTEYDLIKKALLTELARIQGGLIKGDVDATSQKLIDQVLANLTYDQEQGVDPLKSIMGIHNMLQSRYDTKGKIGATDGTTKGEGANQKEANETLKQIYDILGRFIEARQSIADNVRNIRDTLLNKTTSVTGSLYTQELNKIMNSNQMQAMKDALGPTNGLLTRTLAQDVRESSREGIADNAAGRASREANAIANNTLETLNNDASTGFNTDQLASDLIKTNSAGNTDIYNILQDIRDILQTIVTGGIGGKGNTSFKKLIEKQLSGLPSDMLINPETGLFYKSTVKGEKSPVQPRRILTREEEETQKYQSAQLKRFANSIEEAREEVEKGQHELQQRQYLEPSEIITSQKGIFGQLRKVFKDILPQTEVDRIMSMNAEEQARMRAERIETFGLNRGRQLTDTGDIADVKRTKSLFGWIYRNDEKNKQLFQDVRLTPGFTGENRIDTTSIMKSLNKVLSGSEMFKAQTGGTLRNIIGSFTGYIGMPSIEKSRAQAEGLNQVMANVRNEVLGLIQDIQTKEATLLGMQERGTARFDTEGRITEDSSLAAQNTFTKLEEQKQVLRSALAEVGMIDQVVDRTGGKVSDIIKNLGFVMPELMQNNTILQNINAGLDKNGKALKFQTRLAEILNYSFQLMARHIGQIVKNWLWMINPLNMIKKMFDDFASYDPKWQRTMNVIKNNFREIILPFMEKIAQTLVNIIGFLDIISMKIQEAFGYTPISLFDQENANEFKKTYEEIQSVTAGFDELHDIGTSSSENDPDNLLGEIYTPQLSQGWIDLANEIGDLFAGLIKGDLGFGDVMARILEIVWDGLQQIWEWFKGTKLGQWLIENWKSILAKILAIFLGWKLLKMAGQALFNALFGKLTSGAIGSLFTKVGGWITKALNATAFGRGILEGITSVFSGNGGLISTLKSIFVGHGAITAFGAWGETLGALFIQGFGVALGGLGVAKGFDIVADDASYNIGLMGAGGNEEDKKSGLGGKVLGTISGAIAGGFAIGGPIGMAIGGIAGLLVTSLAPAFEEVEVASRNANNEMQKIEYYEGVVQGASTEVNEFSEILELSNQALESQTDKVYSLGEEYGISQTRLDELVQSVKEGTYNTDMLTGSETNLSGALDQLSWHYTNNADLTDKLTEAKKKLQKAEMDLAIAQDIEAGNFELAAARVEVAYASNVYGIDEATKKMTQIIKEGSAEQRSNILQDMSPELKENWNDYYTTTDEGVNEISKLYDNLKESEREAFLQDLDPEIRKMLEERNKVIEEEVNKHPLLKLFDIGNDGKIFGISYIGDIPGYATGTNYVPNDGLAYLHQGEAVIPKKYNQPYQPNSTDQNTIYQMMSVLRSLDDTMKQGISVNGQFVQRGSDLVAVVNKTNSRTGADLLSNVAYAR